MIGPNSFHIKAENKRFPAARALVVGRTSNLKLSRRRLADHVKKIEPESVPHEQHDYFCSFNQSDH